jgi:3-hydroxyacyl-CoA dehydrogenase
VVKPFKKVCVIGAGVMGSGIAAHLANCRIPVLLLDIVPPFPHDPEKHPPEDSKAWRNMFSAGGLKKSLKQKPAPFMSKQDAALIEVGNTTDDLERVKECDWVVEVIIEKLEPKQQLFEKLEALVEPGTVVTSNTSGLEIEDMLAGRGDEFCSNFCVTHFFNPVRYMHLLEVVGGKKTKPEVLERMGAFGEHVLGKGIVHGHDTPNFVANRVGVFGMMETMRLMIEGDYSVEEIDAVFGTATGRPKSAVFNTADVVGLDTFLHVAANCWENLEGDERHEVFKAPEFLDKMVENGWLGRKSKQGFYKMEKTGGKKNLKALNIKTMEYADKAKVRIDSLGAVRGMDTAEERVAHVMWADDRAGEIAWKVGMATAEYAARRLTGGDKPGTMKIADDIVQVDNGMKWGFGWDMGPFETWDAIGVKKSVERWESEGHEIPKWVHDMLAAGRETFYAWEDGERTYWDHNAKKPVVIDDGEKVNSITLLKQKPTNIVQDEFEWTHVDMGDGCLGLEFKTKMNVQGPDTMAGINAALDRCEAGEFDALVIANDGANFSAGANLMFVFMAMQSGESDQVEAMLTGGQKTFQRLKYSKVPTVAATHQMVLAGGCELAMWCNKIRAHAETYIGLVEVGVGILPAWGGNVEMLDRTLAGVVDDPTYPTEMLIRRALETVAMAKVATSAEEGRELMFLAPTDQVTMNRRHLLEAAKWDALGMARAGFTPPRKREFRLPGKGAAATFEMALGAMRDGNYISDHDLKIAMKIAYVMTGGDTSSRVKVSEDQLLDLEREAILSLAGEEKTQARIAHMLEKGKPLRN